MNARQQMREFERQMRLLQRKFSPAVAQLIPPYRQAFAKLQSEGREAFLKVIRSYTGDKS